MQAQETHSNLCEYVFCTLSVPQQPDYASLPLLFHPLYARTMTMHVPALVKWPAGSRRCRKQHQLIIVELISDIEVAIDGESRQNDAAARQGLMN